MTTSNLPANFLSYLTSGSLNVKYDNKPSIEVHSKGDKRILNIIEFPVKISGKPGLIKQLSEGKDLAKHLKKQNITVEIQLKGEPVLRLGKDANPKLAKIITLSSDIEITDIKKLKKLSEII